MDAGYEILHHAERLQKPMNDVIDRGDSPIQQFYNGATVFVTGGSGFMGKHLVEKLLRSCDVKRIYILLRSKKGKTMQERLQFVLSDPVYDVLRAKQPQFADKIVPVEGDAADMRLGVDETIWSDIAKEVNVIFHAAATVKFDEPLRVATLINVRGTRDILCLARECHNLKSFVYVSTAFSSATRDRVNTDVYEQFYPSPISPELLISLVEEVDDKRLNDMTEKFIDGWPNTYTFTKAVAEEYVRANSKDLPICVVRPPIVLPAFYEPSPGWLDMNAATGASGVILAGILGVLHIFRVDSNTKLATVPLDYVNNAIIGAAWDAKHRRNTVDQVVPIYTVSNSDNFLEWKFLANSMRQNVRLSSDKAIYKCSLFECKNEHAYKLLTLLFHYIPAYVLDGCCALIGKRPAGIKSFVSIYKKLDKMAVIYDFFLSYQWNFRDDNVKLMLARMSDADRAIYNCDLTKINFAEYVLIWGLGIRKFIIKDGLNKSNLGHKKQKMFIILNYIVMIFYGYILYSILLFSFKFIKYMFNLVF